VTVITFNSVEINYITDTILAGYGHEIEAINAVKSLLGEEVHLTGLDIIYIDDGYTSEIP
jgi:hypothetical protein